MEFTVTSPKQLGHVLKGCRELRGLTQQETGQRIGYLQKEISKMEHEPGRSRVSRLFKVLSALEFELVIRDKRTALPGHDLEW